MRRCLLLALLSVVLSTGVFAAQSRDVVVMMTIEGVSLHQLQSAHSQDFNVLLQHGAIGLMNNKTDGQQTFKDNAVTIGAGTHAIGEEPPLPTGVKVDSGDGFNATEAVDGVSAERQLRWSIDERVPANAVVHTGIGYVQRINSVQKYKIVPGLLGDMLQQHNIGVRVYGNTDHGEVYARNAVAIAMNRRGWVPSGDVGRHTLIPDDSRPFAVHTNYDYLYSAVAHLSAGEHFVVLELGDCGRAETAKTMMPSKRYAQFKRQALLESLQFARKVDDALRASAQHYLLILAVVDQNATDAQRGDLLTPVLLTGSDIRSGYLFSNTTRKPGILTNIDIAPTVLAFFHMPQDVSMLGGPLQVEHGGTIAHLQAENEQMVATYHARFPILVGYVAFVAFGVLLALLLVILRSQAGGGMVTDRQLMSVRPVLIAIMLVPFCATIAGGLGIHAVGPTGIALLGGSLAIATVLHFFIRDTRLISTIVGLATASLLCVDLLFGQPLLRQSVLSYDAITGIRFYGLGNESSGVLLGATLLGLYALLDHSAFFRRNILWTVVLPYILVFVLVGAPSFGSDFGGMFAALAGFGYALLKARSDRKWRRNMIWTAVVGVILLGVLIATNINLDASKQTHIGRAFHDAMQQGPSIIVDLAVRKWSMNIRLIRSSLWTYALLSLLISLVILFYRPVGIIKGTLRKHPLLNAGFKGIIIGMVVALLTNDSGIAMAATGLLYLAIPLILMVMDVVSARAAGEAVDQQRVGSEASCS